MVERKRQRRRAGGRTRRKSGGDASAGAGVRRAAVALLARPSGRIGSSLNANCSPAGSPAHRVQARRLRRFLRRGLLAATLLALPAFGAAQGFVAKDDKETAKKGATEETVVSAERVTLEDAVAIVRQAHGGRLVSAKWVRRPAPGYRIRIDVDGRVKSLLVDAQGRMSVP